jgi:hypothetical protein
MKSIEFKVVLTEDNKIINVESTTNLPQDSVESQLVIIGILDNLKNKHLNELSCMYEKKFRKEEFN